MILCKNCGNTFEGNYCNQCRQPADTFRITWKELLHHLPHTLFHLDGGILHTIKEMTLRPGEMIREYLAGKRISHFSPLLFLLILGGFGSFLFVSNKVPLLNKEIDLNRILFLNASIAHKYFVLSGVLFILLSSIIDYFFFRYKKYVIPELIVSNAFQFGQVMFFLILLFPLLLGQQYLDQRFNFHVTLRPFLKIALFGYLFWVRYQLYDARGNTRRIVLVACELVVLYVFYNVVIAGYAIPRLLSLDSFK